MGKTSSFSRRKFLYAATGTFAAVGLGIPGFVKGRATSDALLQNITDSEQTWLEINNIIYGAKPDLTGPTGGGKGYSDIITKGDYTVQTLDELIKALSQARAGQVIFIPSETEIDLTARMYIEELVVEVPAGVTLAGDRGNNGSKGAILTSDSLKTPMMICANGPEVRITGLRIQGPNPKRHLEHHRRSFGPEGLGRDYYYKFPVSRGIRTDYPSLEVDNCEISAFTGSAILLREGQGHHIHHNFIHQCQYNGLGYGISHAASSSLVEHNLFNENRHSIAGTGISGCGYIARNNVEKGISLSHCFDMHGGRDRKDSTDIAGTTIEIYNNTFYAPQRAVVIRGIPEDKCDIHHNWFVKHRQAEEAVRGLSGKTQAFHNIYGSDPHMVE